MKQSRSMQRALARSVAVLVVAGAVLAGDVRAQDACTNATFNGLYGLSVEGVVLMPDAPAPIPFNVAGLMQADGTGTLTVFRQMTNLGGTVFPIDWAASV